MKEAAFADEAVNELAMLGDSIEHDLKDEQQINDAKHFENYSQGHHSFLQLK